MTAVFDDCYKQLKILIGDTEINTKTIYVALRFAMEIVEFSETIKEERKEVVRNLLKKLIEELGGEEGEESLKVVDSEYFGQSIDLIVKASKGDLCLNKLQQQGRQAGGGLKKFLGCLCQ